MWKVYAVKTIYRTIVTGEPVVRSDGYSDKYDMIEERIVTFKAMSIEDAIARAEKEADEYSTGDYVNPFGQEYYWQFIGTINAYDPFDNLPAGVEVYSDTYLIDRSLSDENSTNNILGKPIENEEELRVNFLNAEIFGYK